MSVLGRSELDIIGADLKAQLPDRRVVRYAHLDYAASAPCIRAAAEAVRNLLPQYGSVHRGTGLRSRASTYAYDRARDSVAEFVGARPDDAVVFTRNTTDALNLLARALPEATTTVVFDGEHHANLLPWPRTHRLPCPADVRDVIGAADDALSTIGGPVLLAVTGASNVTGEIWPVRQLAEVAHRHGARIVVDAAQLAPHVPIDLVQLGTDYVAFSGHKLYAPFGAGVLAGRADWLDAARPYLLGGGATAAVAGGGREVTWQTGPARHEGGTPNLAGAVSLAAACEALMRTDRVALREHEESLLDELHGVTLFGRSAPRVGIVSFAVPDAGRMAERLDHEFGIGVRAGRFCAHPLADRLLAAGNVPQDGSTGLVRASFGIGSTREEIERLLAALDEIHR